MDLWEILAEELESTGRQLPASFDVVAEAALAAKGRENEQAASDAATEELFSLLHTEPRSALCFSGGGVRSATFGLGIMQGLGSCAAPPAPAADTPLSRFDYLSTVSGGGYVGSWFSAWAHRAETPGSADGPQQVEKIMQQPNGPLDPDPAPLGHIRRYCAFLTPKLGLLSADAWTLASTILRNMLLNWLILGPFLMGLVLLPKIFRSLLHAPVAEWVVQDLLYAGTVLAIVATAYMTSHLPVFAGSSRAGEGAFVTWALIPLTLSAVALSLHWHWNHSSDYWNYPLLSFVIYGAALHGGGWLAGVLWLVAKSRLTDTAKRWPIFAAGLMASVVSGVIAGAGTYQVANIFNARFFSAATTEEYLNWFAALGMPAVLIATLVAALFVVGAASRITGDDDREWWARAGGWIMIVVVSWIAATITVLIGPQWLNTWRLQLSAAIGSLGVGGVVSWLGFTPSTAAGRRADKDSQTERCSPVKDIAVKFAAPAFLWLMLVLLATLNQNLLAWLQGNRPELPSTVLRCEFELIAILAIILFISSPLINVNRFSLHAMYRDRLIRTYLGASRLNRAKTANRFTDFDDDDNLNMADLSQARPLHVVNMALNLVGGKNLAWQQRKAESFTATRLRTGSLRVGYQSTRFYGGKRKGGKQGLSLGSAVAISGAAASPNMGYHSSPLLTLIMTLFNARLGWWLANPGPNGKGAWDQDGPTLAFEPILNEALGRTTDNSKWVYLSDGGHFENLALYEMVLRRCRTIVAVDGSQDSDYNFEDLGNAIRKIRVDLGIHVEFTGGIPIFSPTDLRNRYCGIATIHYEKKDAGAQPGKLLYIKACLNGTESEDVLNYAAINPKFPQQGTEELWFDESQFESYRRLGLHIIQTLSSAAPSGIPGGPIERLIAGAEAYLQTAPPLPANRWPRPPRFEGELAGTLGDSKVDLKGSFRASQT